MQTQPEQERRSYLVSRVSSESRVVLRLLVRNHPGVMSHICGLFARRAFNVEGIVCLPVGDAKQSVAFLLVDDDVRLDQLMLQLDKLEDVITIERAPRGKELFAAAAEHL